MKLERIEVEHLPDGSVEGDKRQHLPVIVKWTCPKCSQRIEDDYARDRYMSYPEMPGLVDLNLYCPHCDWEGVVDAIIRFSLMVRTKS